MNVECVDALVTRALGFQRSGNLGRAALIYRGLIRRRRHTPRILTNYGAICHAMGERIEGLGLFEQALMLDPGYSNAWHNLLVDAENSSAEAMVSVANSVLKAFPGVQAARIGLARAYLANGDPRHSRSILEDLLSDCPDDLNVHEMLVRCSLQLGDLDTATSNLLYIISLNPGDAFAATELSDIASKAGDTDSSFQILGSALEHNPQSFELLFQLGRFHQSCGQLHKAIEFFEQSLALAPDRGNIIASLAYCHAEVGNIDRFMALYRDMVANNLVTPENLIPLVFICSTLGKPYVCDLRLYSEMIWEKRASNRLSIDKSLPASLPNAVTMSICSPLGVSRRRIGILTGDLGVHVVASFLASFVLNYSKDTFEVDIVSNKWRNDMVAERLSSAVDNCLSIADCSEHVARSILIEQNYDVILETSGFTSGTAIFLLDQRCAPVQCHWIGYHASTYLKTMDYFIGDTVLSPDSVQGDFTEKLVKLQRAWLAATPFMPIPEATIKQATDEIIIGSFSQIAKLTDATLLMWANVLSSARHVKLMLKDKFVGDNKIQDRILAFMSRHGVEPERILFEPRTPDWFQHMSLYNRLDLALDTTPWSSATTAFDALSMGVPLVGMLGCTVSSRMSSSVLHHSDRANWIADSPDQYVAKCLSIIDQIQHHRRSKRDYQSQVLRSQLYDGQHLARAMEGFLSTV